jgi:hypothetical protein
MKRRLRFAVAIGGLEREEPQKAYGVYFVLNAVPIPHFMFQV